jgi:hypothetical protein
MHVLGSPYTYTYKEVCRTMVVSAVQAHMQLDIDTKITLLNGVVGDPQVVAKMLQRAPCILTISEVALQVRACS